MTTGWLSRWRRKKQKHSCANRNWNTRKQKKAPRAFRRCAWSAGRLAAARSARNDSRTGASLRACHQAGVEKREGLAEQLRADRARLDQLIDGKAADDAHHDACHVLGRHRQVGGAEVARSCFHGRGEGVAKRGLALGIAGAKLRITDRK